ncbi:hypothetical protein G3570_03885 [Balneolaceae bacterium YR4-1]|uniref:Uncharacterized protein n=1 Tax=Halalkalibaculum roseum TaxID=2709311 RepID=A0A6M1SUI4_9BACT|nr:hypothetical protein [Halalkalibaculum roseum]NGP75758.1 hypothetical protein [Halalkalibaculum roseum]
MKTPVTISWIAFAVILSLLQGCGSTKVHYTVEKRYKPTRSVEILTGTPERSHIVIATLEASSPSYDNGEFVFEKMRNKAQRIGAHAILPIEYQSIPNYSSAPLNPTYLPPPKPGKLNPSPRIFRQPPKSWGKALAIRYLDEDRKEEHQQQKKKSDNKGHKIPYP